MPKTTVNEDGQLEAGDVDVRGAWHLWMATIPNAKCMQALAHVELRLSVLCTDTLHKGRPVHAVILSQLDIIGQVELQTNIEFDIMKPWKILSAPALGKGPRSLI